MNPPLHLEFAMPDPGENPLNLIQLFRLANTLLGGEIVGSYTPYVLQNGTPNVDDQDKIWFELDTQGKPVAIKKFYNGTWRRVYNGMRGEIRGYTGKPTDDFDMSQPSPGRGKIDGIYDGWALCNGKNGTPDLSDQFLIGAHMNDADGHTGYNTSKGGWTTYVSKKDDEHTGGRNEFKLDEKTTWRPDFPGVEVDHWHGGGGEERDPTGKLYGKPDASVDELLGAVEGNTDPDAISIIPPFYALAWMTFIGYT